MSGRDLLLKDKDLTIWWVSVSQDERFDKIMALIRSDLPETSGGWEQLKGATAVLLLLQTITHNDDGATVLPSPGLDHRTLEQLVETRKYPTAQE